MNKCFQCCTQKNIQWCQNRISTTALHLSKKKQGRGELLLFISIGNLNLLMRLSTKSPRCHFFKLASRNHFCRLASTFHKQKRPHEEAGEIAPRGVPTPVRRRPGAGSGRGRRWPRSPRSRWPGSQGLHVSSHSPAGPARAPRAALSPLPPRCKHPAAAAPRPGRAPGSRGTAGPGRRCASCQAPRGSAPGQAVRRERPERCGNRSGQPRHSSSLPSLPPARPRRARLPGYRHCSIPGAAARSPAGGSRDPRSADAAAARGTRGGRRCCDVSGAVTAGGAGAAGSRPAPVSWLLSCVPRCWG